MTVANNAPAAMAAGATKNARAPRKWEGRNDRRHSGRLANALSTAENAIMDLHDEGFCPAAIARRLDLPERRITKTIKAYADDSDTATDAAAQAARMGSDALLRAQLRSGQHSLPSGIAQALIIALRISPPVRAVAP